MSGSSLSAPAYSIAVATACVRQQVPHRRHVTPPPRRAGASFGAISVAQHQSEVIKAVDWVDESLVDHALVFLQVR